MATSPVTPNPAAQPVTKPATAAPTVPLSTTIVNDFAWVKTHVISILVAVAMIVGLTYGGIALIEDLVSKHDARAAAAQQKAEGVNTAAQNALVAQLAQYRAEDATRDAAQTALLTSLVAQMKQQRAETAKQVSTDATLDVVSAASRLATQTKAGPGEVAASNGAVTISLPVTRTVVAALDTGAQAQNDVTNLQGQLGAQKTLTTDTQGQLDTANQVITADKTELISTIKADNDACTVRVDAQAKKDRKRGFWATLGGVVAGIVIGSRI